jgi:hypothetical protein
MKSVILVFHIAPKGALRPADCGERVFIYAIVRLGDRAGAGSNPDRKWVSGLTSPLTA